MFVNRFQDASQNDIPFSGFELRVEVPLGEGEEASTVRMGMELKDYVFPPLSSAASSVGELQSASVSFSLSLSGNGTLMSPALDWQQKGSLISTSSPLPLFPSALIGNFSLSSFSLLSASLWYSHPSFSLQIPQQQQQQPQQNREHSKGKKPDNSLSFSFDVTLFRSASSASLFFSCLSLLSLFSFLL